MKFAFVLAALLSLAAADKWALFVSGNKGWRNYCITSTICRGYDILHEAGVPEDHMIYMGFTDVFDADANPYPGKIFTDRSDGPGIDFSECRPHQDYSDKLVSAELFMSVMEGDVETTKKLTEMDEVRVIESTEEDTIFVYYMDHGAIGFCEVGKSNLKVQVLHDTIKRMWEGKKYKQIVFYFEACHSGSMFEDLPPGMNVYAFTGSDRTHSAWMNNCPPNDDVDGKHFGTCLGAWYDNFWMQEVQDNGSDLTHNEMFKIVHDLTAKETDQNVSQYGDIDTIGEMKVSEFIGDVPHKKHARLEKKGDSIPLEDVAVHLAKWKAIRSNDKAAMAELEEVMAQEALKEVSVMRLARSYFGDDVKANDAAKTAPKYYDVQCVAEVGMELTTRCGYELPIRETHYNVIKNICQSRSVPSFDGVC